MDLAYSFFHETPPTSTSKTSLRWRVRNTFLDFYVPGDDDDECLPAEEGQVIWFRHRSESLDSCRTGSNHSKLGETIANASTRTSSPNPLVCQPSKTELALRANFSRTLNDRIENSHMNGKRNAPASGTISNWKESETCGLTTAMIRNIACRYNTEDVKYLLDCAGFQSKYDFVRVPMKSTRAKTTSNLGYCFVNFTDPSYLVEFANTFNGRRFGIGETQSKKLCAVSLAKEQIYQDSPGLLRGEGYPAVKDHDMIVEAPESRRQRRLKPVRYGSEPKYDHDGFYYRCPY